MKKRYLLPPLIIILVLYLIPQIYKYIMTDQTAYVTAGYFFWDGVRYELSSFACREGVTIAKTRDGSDINRVIGDVERNAVVIRNWIDQQLYIREGYSSQVPLEGTVTAIFNHGTDITNAELCEAFSSTANDDTEVFFYKTNFYRDNILNYTDVELYFEHSPLGIRRSVGVVNNQWVYIDIRSGEINSADDADDERIASCTKIDERYIPIIEEYFGDDPTSNS